MKNRILPLAAMLLIAGSGAQQSVARDHDHHAHEAVLGQVNFPISCTPEAQAKFNTTIALLYSFYWEKIDASVGEVLAADPTCAMAYWAKAVASIDNALGSPPTPKLEKQGWEAVLAAKQLGGKTQRERDYISAVEILFKDHDSIPFAKRAKAYEKALEHIHLTYPEDTEAT